MAPARLLDLTRSLRRAGRVATGIDRVEQAYLAQFLQDDVPVFGVFRTAFGYVLLDRAGLTGFRDRLEGHSAWGSVGIMARLVRNRDPMVQRAESDVRRMACARVSRSGLIRMLGGQLDPGYDYYNVGHSNLTDRMLKAVKQTDGAINVLIHDVIPLEHPEFQRDVTVPVFRDKLRRVGAMADRVIYNSADTRKRAEGYLLQWGRVPPATVAHLGVHLTVPDVSKLPAGIMPERPFFVTVGTIEPRKNHAFLLDLWEFWGPDAPPLLICGNRGWNNAAVFDRLDRLPPENPVQEVNGLSDPALAALVQGASGSLFPSLAEGFGLPPVEAAALGTRVLCNELPVLREILNAEATFIPVFERQMWLDTLKKWEKSSPIALGTSGFNASGWPDHFKTVLRLR